MIKWRPDVVEEAIKSLADFVPSTTIEDGDKLDTDLMEKQRYDWEQVKKIVSKFNLGVKELGYVWYWCDCKFNWRGWSTVHGLMFKMAAMKQKESV